MTMPTFAPVAFIAPTWQIFFMGSCPIAQLTKKHNLKIGSELFTESQLQQAYEAGKRDAVPEDIRKNAERYQLLRSGNYSDDCGFVVANEQTIYGESLDEFCDSVIAAAMKGEKE